MSDCTCSVYHRHYGKHREWCPRHVSTVGTAHAEHRAVFSYPPTILGPTPDTYGPWRLTLAEAAKDSVPRSEETLGWRSGFQRRLVTDPAPEKVYAELDAVPLMADPRATEEERTAAGDLHGLWVDMETLQHSKPGDPTAMFSTVNTRLIVYREDGAAAEVHTLRRDWNKR